jgi:hypothetical protein
MAKKAQDVINQLLGEGAGMDTIKENELTADIRKFIQKEFPKTDIHLIKATGEVWEINLEAPLKPGVMNTGQANREIGKSIAYDHRDAIQKYIEKNYNFTPMSVGGLDANQKTVKFLIQFTLRNTPMFKVIAEVFAMVEKEQVKKK